MYAARIPASTLTEALIRNSELRRIEPFLSLQTGFECEQSDAGREISALDRVRLFPCKHQIFKFSHHETPMIVQIKQDVKTGRIRLRTVAHARREKIVA